MEKAKEDVAGVREQIMRITAELVGSLDKRHDDLKVRVTVRIVPSSQCEFDAGIDRPLQKIDNNAED